MAQCITLLLGGQQTVGPAACSLASRFTLRVSRLLLVGLCPAAPISFAAQTPQQLDFLCLNPQPARLQLLKSGVMLEQIPEPTAVQLVRALTEQQIRGVHALGTREIRAQGQEPIRVDAGLVVCRAPRCPEAEPDTLQLFWLNAFRGRSTALQPVLSGPVAPTYRLGRRDVLVLVITGDVELLHELKVTLGESSL